MIVHGIFTNVEKENSGNLEGTHRPGGRSTKLFLGFGISGTPSLILSLSPTQAEVEGKGKVSLHLLFSDNPGKMKLCHLAISLE